MRSKMPNKLTFLSIVKLAKSQNRIDNKRGLLRSSGTLTWRRSTRTSSFSALFTPRFKGSFLRANDCLRCRDLVCFAK